MGFGGYGLRVGATKTQRREGSRSFFTILRQAQDKLRRKGAKVREVDHCNMGFGACNFDFCGCKIGFDDCKIGFCWCNGGFGDCKIGLGDCNDVLCCCTMHLCQCNDLFG